MTDLVDNVECEYCGGELHSLMGYYKCTDCGRVTVNGKESE